MPLTHREIITFWPSQSALAKDLGMKANNVHVWRWKSRIPQKHWDGVVASAIKYGIAGVDWAALNATFVRRDGAPKES